MLLLRSGTRLSKDHLGCDAVINLLLFSSHAFQRGAPARATPHAAHGEAAVWVGPARLDPSARACSAAVRRSAVSQPVWVCDCRAFRSLVLGDGDITT